MGSFDIFFRTGSARGSIEEVLLESLLEADGTAPAKDVDSYVWAEHFAEARALAYLWHTNRRLALQWDPDRMTDFIPRWERILGLRPLASDLPTNRRAKIKAKIGMFGREPTQDVVSDLLTLVLGTIFQGIARSSSTTALGSVPGGAAVPGGATLSDGPFYSSIAYLGIEAVKPAAMSEATFYDTVSQVYAFLDDLLPAWVSFDWFRDGTHGAGFFLDEEGNLDNQRFR